MKYFSILAFVYQSIGWRVCGCLSDAGVPRCMRKNVKTQGKDLWKSLYPISWRKFHPGILQNPNNVTFEPASILPILTHLTGDMSLDLRGKSLSLPLSVQFEIPNTKHLAKDISPDLKWKCPVKDVECWSPNVLRASPNCIRCNNWISKSNIAIDLT